MKANVSFRGQIFVRDVQIADTFWYKLCGYMFRSEPHVSGFIFEPCNSIQTTFMRFDLDLVFLSKDNQVVKIIKNMRPWRFTTFYFKAKRTLELPAGLLPSDLKEGDTLEVTHV